MIPRRQDRGPAPLSFAQQRLWFVSQLSPGNPFYNVTLALRLEGRLDAATVQRALTELVRRHEVLRTRFVVIDGVPRQQVDPARTLPLETLDRRPVAPERRVAVIQEVGEALARRPVSLERGPLFSAVLVALAEEDHVLMMMMHHIVVDQWSIGVIVREFGQLHAAFARGEPSPLPELGLQYADFSVWQRARLSGAWEQELTAFWRRTLEGAPTTLELPTDRPRPPVQTFAGDEVDVALSPEDSERFTALGRSRGATPSMVLLAAWSALISRYTGQKDLVIGCTAGFRDTAETEQLIGCFINMMPLRIQLEDDPSFLELIDRARGVSLDAFSHRELPFERIVELLRPDRSLSHTQLVQVYFQFQPSSIATVPPGSSVRQSLVNLHNGRSKFDLMLNASDRQGRITGNLEFSTDLFDRATVERLATHLTQLVRSALDAPEQRISRLRLLPEPERVRLAGWSTHPAPPPPERGLHHAFEAQARRTPGHPALVDGDTHLSYAELDARAERLARRLRAAGVGPGSIAGVALERGADAVVALLAVLKAGGAYLPLDLSYPAERLRFMARDAGLQVLIARAPQGVQLAPGVPCIEPSEGADGTGTGLALAADSAAYLIYTSGSTGQPKAVVISHRNAVSLVEWALRDFSREELGGVLASTSFCFDLSVFELFVPLSCGGTVILAENLLALPRLPAAGAVTLVNSVPSVVAELLRLGGLPSSVRTVNLAGEPLPRDLAQALYALPHVRRVENLYAPSETTTYSTRATVPRDAARPPTIGRPIPGTYAYVLDPHLVPTPVGVPGELYLGGEGVARGYWRRPDVTAARFLPDLFRDVPGARMYRTGDLARWLPDGELQFLGRTDEQLKLRGLRIEPGEIESRLREQPGVRDAAVVAVPSAAGGGGTLAAYVVGEPEVGREPELLRQMLRRHLPEFMLPTAWVLLEALPRLPSGKLDRRALPAVPAPGLERAAAPLLTTEAFVAAIWGELLGRAMPSGASDFFEVGGHSLLAVRLTSRVRAAFGVDVPLRTLFESPMLEEYGRQMRAAQLRARGLELPAVRALARTGEPRPLAPRQRALWRAMQGGREVSPLWRVLRLRGLLEVERLERAVEQWVLNHGLLRARFREGGSGPVWREVVPGPVRLDATDAEAWTAEERARALRQAAAATLDVEEAPPFRCRLFRAGPREHLLLLAFHPLIADAWSVHLLARELESLYRDGPRPAAPGLEYADHAAWLEGEGQALLTHQLGFWRERLVELPPLVRLPRTGAAGAGGARGRTRTLELPAPVVARLETLARESASPPLAVYLTAFQGLLHTLHGASRFPLALRADNRDGETWASVVGPLANTVLLGVEMDGALPFAVHLQRVRRQLLQVLLHQELPFERVAELAERELGRPRQALAGALFAMRAREAGADELEEGSVSGEELGFGEAELACEMDVRGPMVSLALTYAGGLCTPEEADRWLRHLATLLTRAAEDARQPVARLMEEGWGR
jgi:amino acid adenylation domain-containing protein